MATSTRPARAPRKVNAEHPEQEIPLSAQLASWVMMTWLLLISWSLDFVAVLRARLRGSPPHPLINPEKGYGALSDKNKLFYVQRMYGRTKDLFNRPIASRPGEIIDVVNRHVTNNALDSKHCTPSGGVTPAINTGSYNYLGFSETSGPVIDRVQETLQTYGIATCSPIGDTELHLQLEQEISQFVGKEAALIFSMGFATNSTVLPALVGPGDLVISDALNHASVVTGCRASGAKVSIFKHQNAEHLDKVLREAITEGQPRTHLPWGRILVVVEGIYSMEGEMCNLPAIVAVKKKYGAYLYLDEAHSIGAIGATGRGVTEYTGVSPTDVDIMMGTFTKSFAAVGGYVAGSREMVNYLRHSSYSPVFEQAMSTPCVQQALSALRVINGSMAIPKDYLSGPDRLRALRENCEYLRSGLINMGFAVMGATDSPVIPVLIVNPGKFAMVSRLMLQFGLAIVVVGPPATPLGSIRMRLCVSSRHTREMMDEMLRFFDYIGDLLWLKFLK